MKQNPPPVKIPAATRRYLAALGRRGAAAPPPATRVENGRKSGRPCAACGALRRACYVDHQQPCGCCSGKGGPARMRDKRA